MKTIICLSALLAFAFNLTSADAPKVALFEVHWVSDKASDDTEKMTLPRRPGSPPQDLNVQKSILLDDKTVSSAWVTTNKVTVRPEIQMQLTQEGAKTFAKLTQDSNGKRLAFLLDGKLQSAPIINSSIPNGRFTITGPFTFDDAHRISNRLAKGGHKQTTE